MMQADTMVERQRRRLTETGRPQRKQDVLTHGRPSMVASIAEALVIKDESLYFLCDEHGDVPMRGDHGLGLYYHDCRYLDGYEVRIAGDTMNPLVASATHGHGVVIELTNSEITPATGDLIPKESLGVKLERLVDGRAAVLHDRITLRNFGVEAVSLPVSFHVRSGFDDVFAVRSLTSGRHGELTAPAWHGDVLRLDYLGGDDVCRRLEARFSPAPRRRTRRSASMTVALGPGESKSIDVTFHVFEFPAHSAGGPHDGAADIVAARSSLRADTQAFVDAHAAVTSDNELLNRVVDRSLRDLRMLRSRLDGLEYYAAGVPWFVTLFGRDSITTAMQMLAFSPRMANQTLRLLASYQGTKRDDWRDETPGKILHELRIGELARMGEIPHTPYYGSIDATPLFVILMAEYLRWTGDFALFRELRGHIDRALAWIESEEQRGEGGYITYDCASGKGLINQGWKDSGDGIVQASGALAEPPIALAEVQGYAYRARLSIAAAYEREGDATTAQRLRDAAAALRARFNRDFWLERERTYVLGRQRGGRPLDVVASNAGQTLWSGIAEAAQAAGTRDRLMARDMFSGWGIRTLSARERRFNPVGYHLGTVWPHDNAMIAAGFRQYGFDHEATRILRGILDAAMYFREFRLPELFAGFSRREYAVPVRYPVACHPQAWAAGSIPYLVTSCLGLEPDALERRLRVHRPVLPDYTTRLTLRGVRVADAMADLAFTKDGHRVHTQVLRVEGDLTIDVTGDA